MTKGILRITVVTRIFSPEPAAASLRLDTLVNELQHRGHEVTVLTTTPPKRLRPVQERAGTRRWPVLRDRSGYVRGYLQYMSFDVPLFFRVVFGSSADVYVVEPPPTTGTAMRLATAFRRRPYAYYAADIWSDAAAQTGAAGFVVRMVRALEGFAMRGAAIDLSVSQGVSARLAQLAPRADVVLVGHGVDTSLFTPNGSRRPMGADIVYVGTMSEWHGARIAVEALIKVMETSPDLTAAFIGQGSERESMQAAVIEAGLQRRIRFFDPVPAAEAAEWLRSARVALATLRPGAGYDFAVPTKLYAALACGTPVAYCGPDPVHSLVDENELGRAADYDAEQYASAIFSSLELDPVLVGPQLREWAEKNVSSRAVAEKAAAAIESVGAAEGA